MWAISFQAFLKSINIAFQHQCLQTTAEIGYVVMEVDSNQAEEALEQLKAIEGTIRTRLLH
ncbi:hypothetical protein [Shewanella benthica]|uniref:hypothetical protein n=1 Tax=Shewanella benthica TaxID=43661 RepID=UPI0026A7D303